MTFGIVQLMPMLSLHEITKDFPYALVVIHNLFATYYLFK